MQGVAGDADETHQSLLPGLDCSFQSAARAENSLHLFIFDDSVQLQHIDMIGVQAFQRPVDRFLRVLIGSLPSFRSQEKFLAMFFDPGSEANL
jgi:hypothetical protein